MSPERRFPTEEELDQWMLERVEEASGAAGHEVDQIKAAAAESVSRLVSMTPQMIATGRASWAFSDNTGEPDPGQLRAVARQFMVAVAAGLRSLCDHTQLIRPLMLVCDPPVIVCVACVRSGQVDPVAVSRRIGHFWDHQCDRCGAGTERLTGSTVSGFGPFTIIGHICPQCLAEDHERAARLAETVVLVPRRHPKRPPPGARGRRNKR